jgi:molybdopterin converting factor small subunit
MTNFLSLRGCESDRHLLVLIDYAFLCIMRIQLFCFGQVKEVIGGNLVVFECNEGDTVKTLKTNLLNVYGGLKEVPDFRFAVNQEYVGEDYELAENDEVAIIPPVSGG